MPPIDHWIEVEAQADYLLEHRHEDITEPDVHGAAPDDLSRVASHLGSDEAHHKFYKEVLKAGPMVQQWVEHGYTPPFSTIPPTNRDTKNNKSAILNQEFLEEETLKMVKAGILKEVFTDPHVINPLSVVLSNKWR